jgi:hypothetical protein
VIWVIVPMLLVAIRIPFFRLRGSRPSTYYRS